MFDNKYIVQQVICKVNEERDMRTSKNMFIAFVLNLLFSVFELFGGLFSGSIAIMSDAVHDMGDAMSIGLAYFFEKKSEKKPDDKYTYGYARYSVLGSVITTVILLCGSVLIIVNAVKRIIDPTAINYNSMIVLAIIGVVVNFIAAYVTHGGGSLNQKAVNLHMLEDVLSWIVVLIGAIVMRFTDFALIDPIMSVAVAVFVLYNALKNLKSVLDIFLLKTPDSISVDSLRQSVKQIEGVIDVHHIHIWSSDGENMYATMHIVCKEYNKQIKHTARHLLEEQRIICSTIEIEEETEVCHDKRCSVKPSGISCHHHH